MATVTTTKVRVGHCLCSIHTIPYLLWELDFPIDKDITNKFETLCRSGSYGQRRY